MEKSGSPSRSAVLLTVVAAAIILFLRKTDALTNPQFWAEDGTIFFSQQYSLGASAIFHQYAGYLHLIPRLVALVTATFFPYSATPYVYNYAALILSLLVVLSVFSKRLEINHKPLLALSIVLVPHFTNEVFLTITNLQWLLFLLLVITLLKEPPHERYGNARAQAAIDFIIIFFCGLTGPFIILLMPFFLWKLLRNRSLHNTVIFGEALTVSAVQTFVISTNTASTTVQYHSPPYYAPVLGQKLFGNFFLGKYLPYQMNPYLLTGLLIAVVLFISYFASRGGNKERFRTSVLLGFMFTVTLATLFKFRSAPLVLVPPGQGLRYFYPIYIMLAWSLITCLDSKKAWSRNLARILLAAALVSSLTSGFHSSMRDYNWAGYSALIKKGRHLIIPINPPGWYIKLSGANQQSRVP